MSLQPIQRSSPLVTFLNSPLAAATTAPLFSLSFSSNGLDALAHFSMPLALPNQTVSMVPSSSTPRAPPKQSEQPTPPNGNSSSPPLLPSFEPSHKAVFAWGPHSPESFTKLLDDIYSEVVHWRKNTFSVPFGKVGKEFTAELSRLYCSFGNESSLESIAMKAAIVLPLLALQRPHRCSKQKDHISCLSRRMGLWKQGQLSELVLEGRTIQIRLTKYDSHQGPQSDPSRAFAKLMFTGKTKQALDLLSNTTRGGILHLNNPSDPLDPSSPTVKHILVSKHPESQPADPSCILPSDPEPCHPIIFDSIDGSAIRSAALNVHGSAGPSGLDAHAWRRLCTSFKGASTDLCNSLALVAKRLCTSHVDPSSLSSFLACRLIALDKSPGVRPIGIGDTARRIIAKAVLFVTKPDIQDASGCLQMCGGQIAGIEAAVHAVRTAFKQDDCEGVLLVDATNAFNSLNRQTAMLNIQQLCPPLANIIINCYRSPTDLFVDGQVLLSEEGTTQGDPLAMPMYALATIPLIKQLEGESTQVWYADDAAAAGKICSLRDWWDKLSSIGPLFGYFPNASKSWLVTKETFLSEAKAAFAGTRVNITNHGRPYLGAAIGTNDFVSTYVKTKVKEWISYIDQLALIAKTQPHAAFSALTHGLSSKWTYLSRTIPDIYDLLLPLDNAIRSKLIPELTGRPPPNDLEFNLFSIPARLGGLGINIPSKTADKEFTSSLQVTSPICQNILLQCNSYTEDMIKSQLNAKASIRSKNKFLYSASAKSISSKLPEPLKKAVTLAQEQGASTWLTALPLQEHGFSLHKGAFRDALALRYGWIPANLSTHCACGKKFSIEHAFSCPKGGFPSIRHNEIRDITATLLTEVCHNVSIEPNLQPITTETMHLSSANTEDGARLDIAADGFWGCSSQRTFFDVRVFNPHAPSNNMNTSSSCYRKHELAKKRAYSQRIREIEHSSFTPLILSATGGLANEATVFYKRLASMLATKWDQPYSSTLCWLRCLLGFSLLRSAIRSLRGSRSTCGHALKTPAVADLVNSESGITL